MILTCPCCHKADIVAPCYICSEEWKILNAKYGSLRRLLLRYAAGLLAPVDERLVEYYTGENDRLGGIIAYASSRERQR